ncbi:hypothetical protein AS889_28735 [Pseudomonas putida]|nr:hypothetical protein AS889_28735 [Pseudomonas putida]
MITSVDARAGNATGLNQTGLFQNAAYRAFGQLGLGMRNCYSPLFCGVPKLVMTAFYLDLIPPVSFD